MSRASFAWSPVSAWKNSRVPDFAMVPMLATTSSRDMPTPLSEIVMVRARLSKETRIFRSASEPYKALSESASKRSLSAASEALETSSLRKISLLPYKEWIMRWSSCFTSVWKPRVSFAIVAAMALSTPTFSGIGGPWARAKDEAAARGFQVRAAASLAQARIELAPPPLAQPAGAGLPAGVARVTSVEGVTEYRLANGLKILLIPDRSIDTVTVNVTYLVGS